MARAKRVGGRSTTRTDPSIPQPATRQMSVIAQDPSIRRADGSILMARLDVPAEELSAGPIGYRVHVVDYDSSSGHYLGAHRLPECFEDEPAAWQAGRASIVDDRRFRAQNVYALVMKTLSRFEFALGRRVGWSFGVHQLKVAPNGMLDANAFYSPRDEGLVFGYFPDAGGRPVHTCLSHDIVVHETTHALLDALRERYLDPSGPDQAAFHEGFADVIALLSVFAQVELVRELLRRDRSAVQGGRVIRFRDVSARALRQSALFGLAEQMGSELQDVRGQALRRSAELEPDPGWLKDPEFAEPHRRGEILVAAVMNGFIEAWTSRLRAAETPGQSSHPLLRVAEEGSDIAKALIKMWIRALDYMPPVHLTFGDALSAVLTADLEAWPDDERFGLRDHLRTSFRRYGIRPASERADGIWGRAPLDLRYERVRFESMRTDKDEVFRFLWDNRKALDIKEGAYTEVLSVRPCLRVGLDGFTLRETVAEFYQVARLTPSELRAKGILLPPAYTALLRAEQRAGGIRRAKTLRGGAAPNEGDVPADPEGDPVTPVYGGAVLIFDEYGKLKYRVHNDVFGSRQSERLRYLFEVGQLRAGERGAQVVGARLSALHRQRSIDARRFPQQGW